MSVVRPARARTAVVFAAVAAGLFALPFAGPLAGPLAGAQEVPKGQAAKQAPAEDAQKAEEARKVEEAQAAEDAKAAEEAQSADDVKAAAEFTGKPQRNEKVEIKPFNECYVKNDDGTVVSYFGYELGKPGKATLPAGSDLNFVTGASANSGQPSTFTHDAHHFVFSVTWKSSKEAPVWYLNGYGAGATDSNTVCKEVPAVPEFPVAVAGPVIALGAVGGWFALRRRRDLAAV